MPKYNWTRVLYPNGGYGYVKTDNNDKAIEYKSDGTFKVYSQPNEKSHSFYTSFETRPRTIQILSGDHEAHLALQKQVDDYVNQVIPSTGDFFQIGTFGGLNNLSPTQWGRRLYDAGKLIQGKMSKSDYINRWFFGNNGIVSDEYARKHPYRTMAANLIGDVATFGTVSTLRKMPSWYRTMLAENQAVQDIVADNWKNIGKNNNLSVYAPYSTPKWDVLPIVYRSPAKTYYEEWNGKNPSDYSDKAFIELRSHPEGHATVAERHLINNEGKDITFTFDNNPRKNVLLLEFDDSHGPSVFTLNKEQIVKNVESGNWKNSKIAKEVNSGKPRESITFRNMTPEQADYVIDFLDNNSGKDVYVHCLRGSSRSGAFDKFLEDFYGYTRPKGKNVNSASPEVYKALTEAYARKHSTLHHKRGGII